MKDYTNDYYKTREVKYASYMNCGSYACRMSPFFDTVGDAEEWEKSEIGDTDNYIRPVANWEQIIRNRNSVNTDSVVPIGQ